MARWDEPQLQDCIVFCVFLSIFNCFVMIWWVSYHMVGKTGALPATPGGSAWVSTRGCWLPVTEPWPSHSAPQRSLCSEMGEELRFAMRCFGPRQRPALKRCNMCHHMTPSYVPGTNIDLQTVSAQNQEYMTVFLIYQIKIFFKMFFSNVKIFI